MVQDTHTSKWRILRCCKELFVCNDQRQNKSQDQRQSSVLILHYMVCYQFSCKLLEIVVSNHDLEYNLKSHFQWFNVF